MSLISDLRETPTVARSTLRAIVSKQIALGIPPSTILREAPLDNGVIRRVRATKSGKVETYEISADAYRRITGERLRPMKCKDWIIGKLQKEKWLALEDIIEMCQAEVNPPFSRSTLLRTLKSLTENSIIAFDAPNTGLVGRPARLYRLTQEGYACLVH